MESVHVRFYSGAVKYHETNERVFDTPQRAKVSKAIQ
jgi:hypothetical protein